jgi:hypothetical protein
LKVFDWFLANFDLDLEGFMQRLSENCSGSTFLLAYKYLNKNNENILLSSRWEIVFIDI